jgi:hypothetical protein
VGCMIVDVGVMSFGSFLFSVLAGWMSVALRVLIAVFSCSFGFVLLPFGSLAIVAGVGGMWYMVVPLGSVVLVIKAFHCVTHVSQSGARYLSSLLE